MSGTTGDSNASGPPMDARSTQSLRWKQPEARCRKRRSLCASAGAKHDALANDACIVHSDASGMPAHVVLRMQDPTRNLAMLPPVPAHIKIIRDETFKMALHGGPEEDG